MSDASRHLLYMIPETEYGVTPPNPAFQAVRHTGTTLGIAKGSQLSEELHANRQIVDFRHGTLQAGGNITLELSFGSHDALLEAALAGTWDDEGVGHVPAIAASALLILDTQPAPNDTLVIGSTTYTFVDHADFDSAGEIPIGNTLAQTQQSVRNAIYGTDGQNVENGDVTITDYDGDDIASVVAKVPGTAGNSISVSISATGGNGFSSATLEDGADEVPGTPGIKTLRAGVTRRSFTFLRVFDDQAPEDGKYHIFRGVEINTMEWSVTPDGLVTVTLGVIGRDAEILEAAPSGATFGEPTTTRVFNAFSGTVKENDVEIGIATEISHTLENGMEARFVIGSNKTIRPSIGRSNLTGTLGAWFENADLVQRFWDETKSSIKYQLEDPDGNQIEITIPNISFTGGQPDVSGQSSIPLSMPFQAIMDPDTKTQIEIVCTPASLVTP